VDTWEQARRLFRALRAMDEAGVKHIWAQCPDDTGMGLAVVNRLSKASGFHILDA
jgi:L-threonylcarbamoyladenylate synthase